MRIPTLFHEDVPDFATVALICSTCNHEVTIVGPVPKKASCQKCGAKKLIRKTCAAEGSKKR